MTFATQPSCQSDAEAMTVGKSSAWPVLSSRKIEETSTKSKTENRGHRVVQFTRRWRNVTNTPTLKSENRQRAACAVLRATETGGVGVRLAK